MLRLLAANGMLIVLISSELVEHHPLSQECAISEFGFQDGDMQPFVLTDSTKGLF